MEGRQVTKPACVDPSVPQGARKVTATMARTDLSERTVALANDIDTATLALGDLQSAVSVLYGSEDDALLHLAQHLERKAEELKEEIEFLEDVLHATEAVA